MYRSRRQKNPPNLHMVHAPFCVAVTWYIRASRQENVDDLYAPVIDEDSAGAHV